jgi:hypothetical protein
VAKGKGGTDKSWVTLEQQVCVVCGKEFDTGSLLLDKRLLDHKTVTGWGLCPDHAKLKADGYVALVGCDDAKSPKKSDGTVDPAEAWRTGDLIHIRESLWASIFNVGVPEKGVCFCDARVIEMLKNLEEQRKASPDGTVTLPRVKDLEGGN